MLSFIVIGKNESFKLQLCINSIYVFCGKNKISDFEVIYVDSRSCDGSVEHLVKEHPSITVLRVEGECNAAIARNIGARVAKGELFFFIDGDMELNPAFLFSQTLVPASRVLASGQLKNIIYNKSFTAKLRTADYYPHMKTQKTEVFFGGIFIIESSLWKEFKGMRNTFVFGEDIDLSMRLSHSGYKLTRYPEYIANHHTFDKTTTLRNLVWNACYSRGYLYRKNIFNKFLLKRILRSDPTVLCLVACAFTAFIFDLRLLFVYPFIVVAAILIANRAGNFIQSVFFQILRDMMVIFWFLFFYPSEKAERFTVINNEKNFSLIKF